MCGETEIWGNRKREGKRERVCGEIDRRRKKALVCRETHRERGKIEMEDESVKESAWRDR